VYMWQMVFVFVLSRLSAGQGPLTLQLHYITITISSRYVYKNLTYQYVRKKHHNNLTYRHVRKGDHKNLTHLHVRNGLHNNLIHRWFCYTYIDVVTETTTTTTTTIHYFYFLTKPATVQNVIVSVDRHTCITLIL
jgi:negative regulator of sigma E activity